MMRAYALSLGAGTQTITEGIGEAIFSKTQLCSELAKAIAWIINLAIAEWAIRRSTLKPRERRRTNAQPQPAGATTS